MTNTQRIEKYIKECFYDLSINIKEYFYYDFEENNWEEISWTNDDGTINLQAVEYASEILGISIDDILSTNDEAIMKWLKKYPYLIHVNAFRHAYARTYYGKGYDEMCLIETIFEMKLDEAYPDRFDYDDIKNRLIEKLKKIDESLPGTYHDGATITKLSMSTENFCKFKEIKEMTESFISMIYKAIELFLKIINDDLTADEIKEYNMLVSVLGLRDRYFVNGYLYYSNLIKAKELYSMATIENINDYIIFKHALEFEPWKCSGFINDKELVKKYLLVMPQAKGLMREFAMNASKFKCMFIWSDAKPVVFSPEEEAELAEIDKILGEESIPVEKRAKEPTIVYIEKNSKELNGDDEVAQKLVGYCRPIKLGGLEVKMSEHSFAKSTEHIQFLLGKVSSNRFIERIFDGFETSGGGTSE